MNNTYLAQRRPGHHTEGLPMSTPLQHPLNMKFMSFPWKRLQLCIVPAAIDLLHREQDSEIGAHTNYTSPMVRGTVAGTSREADKEMRTGERRQLVDVDVDLCPQ